MSVPEYPPGARVSVGGVYEQRNVLGAPTGDRVTMASGDPLPAAPRGFTWRLLEAPGDDTTAY
jgi:hypothetical protein